MSRKTLYFLIFSIVAVLTNSGRGHAESELESKFQDMFVTAGYSAAAGAAIGAALLTFQDEPTKHLKFVSIGASLGFLSGTAIGSWMMIAPVFVDNSKTAPMPLATNDRSERFVVRPWFDISKKRLLGLEAGAVLANF